MPAPGVDEIARRAGEIDLAAGASLEVTLGRVATVLERGERRRAQLAAAISYIPGRVVPQFAGSALPVAPGGGYGPTPGYTWAVQAIRVAGLGTADFLNLYRGNSVAAVQPETALFTFTVTVTGAVAAWHPGGSGLLISGSGQEGFVFGGTVASAGVTVNFDVIQIADAQLPYYLL